MVKTEAAAIFEHHASTVGMKIDLLNVLSIYMI